MASSITEAELLDALQEALAGTEVEDGHSLNEIKELTGWGTDKARKTLKRLIVAGKWEPVALMRESPLRPGVSQVVCGYRPVVPSD